MTRTINNSNFIELPVLPSLVIDLLPKLPSQSPPLVLLSFLRCPKHWCLHLSLSSTVSCRRTLSGCPQTKQGRGWFWTLLPEYAQLCRWWLLGHSSSSSSSWLVSGSPRRGPSGPRRLGFSRQHGFRLDCPSKWGKSRISCKHSNPQPNHVWLTLMPFNLNSTFHFPFSAASLHPRPILIIGLILGLHSNPTASFPPIQHQSTAMGSPSLTLCLFPPWDSIQGF